MWGEGRAWGEWEPPPRAGACNHHPPLVFLEHDVQDMHSNAVEGVRVDHGPQEGQEGADHGGDDDEAGELGPGGRRTQLWDGGWEGPGGLRQGQGILRQR